MQCDNESTIVMTSIMSPRGIGDDDEEDENNNNNDDDGEPYSVAIRNVR